MDFIEICKPDFQRVFDGVHAKTPVKVPRGAAFVKTFQNRIDHILEANGAFFDGSRNRGHAQKNQEIAFNTIQPYSSGLMKGLYPTIEIRP